MVRPADAGVITGPVFGDGEPVLGVGQRTFLVGDEALPIMQLESIEVTQAG